MIITQKVDLTDLVDVRSIPVICPGCPSEMERGEIPYGPNAGVYDFCGVCGFIDLFDGDPKLPFAVPPTVEDASNRAIYDD